MMSTNLRPGMIRFAVTSSPCLPVSLSSTGASVAADRYRKAIKAHESDRAESNYARSGLAGAGIGALVRGKMARGRAALIGAGAGLATQAVTRAATAGTKDSYGDRPLVSKKIEKVPWQAGLATAGVLGYQKLRRKIALAAKVPERTYRFSAETLVRLLERDRAITAGLRTATAVAPAVTKAAPAVAPAATGKVRKALSGKNWLALTGGIGVADAATSAVMPERGESRPAAAGHGLAKGLLYGGVLASAEPVIGQAVKKVIRGKMFSARGRVIAFGGDQQMRGKGNRFVDKMAVASGAEPGYVEGKQVNLPVMHGQVLRAAWNKGRVYQGYGSRAGALARDVRGALRGEKKMDARGRPVKREWEKTWVRNAVGTGIAAGALLAHTHVMKRNPAYRAKVTGAVRAGKKRANAVIPDLFPMSAKIRGVIQFDTTAPNWDVRDERGRSARVFAPGSRRRERREKNWYERQGTQRTVLGALAIAAGAGGLALGHKVGQVSGARKVRSAMAKKGWETRRAGAAENATIERMKKRPPGGGGVTA